MKKVYKAKTVLSINVVLENKKNLHISFSPLSNGNSTFVTDNEEIIKAIEKHYNFGKLFTLEEAIEERPYITPEEFKKKDEGVKRVKVSDIATAKDYLATSCGISRTVLRSEKSIMEQAAACGIEFYGINGEE